MKVLIINPNTTKEMTRAIEETSRANAASGTKITCVTASEGAAFHVLGVIKEREADFDAFVIACGANPGLDAARVITRKPVAGIGESGMLTACAVAAKFSVIIPAVPRACDAGWSAVRALGLENRCASVRSTGKGVLGGFFIDRRELEEMLYMREPSPWPPDSGWPRHSSPFQTLSAMAISRAPPRHSSPREPLRRRSAGGSRGSLTGCGCLG